VPETAAAFGEIFGLFFLRQRKSEGVAHRLRDEAAWPTDSTFGA
jgi:hypothetical protein